MVVEEPEMKALKILAKNWNDSLNMKFLPVGVQRVLHGHSITDFYILNVYTFSDLFLGGGVWNHRIPELCEAVGKQCPIEAGDCVCVFMGAFPFRFGRFQGSHPWMIVDVKKGVLDQGEVTMEKAWACAGLPSDSERGDAMLSS